MFAIGDKVIVKGYGKGRILRPCKIYEFMRDGTELKGHGFIVSCEDGFLRSCGLTQLSAVNLGREEVAKAE